MNQVKPVKKSKASAAPVVETESTPDITQICDEGLDQLTRNVDVLSDAFGFDKVETPDPVLISEVEAQPSIAVNPKVVASPPTAWEATDTGYPEPTVITIDENTDLSKIADMAQDFGAPKVRRVAIGIKMFLNEEDFLAWQQAEPREVFEITPTAVTDGRIKMVIFVTYANGIIE